eukprot:6106479-Amphidinium_carterae.1
MSTPPAKPDGNGPIAPGPLAQKRLGRHVRRLLQLHWGATYHVRLPSNASIVERPVKVVVDKMQEDAERHLDYMAQRNHMDKECANVI